MHSVGGMYFFRCIRKIDKPTISFVMSLCPSVPPSSRNKMAPSGVCVYSHDKSQVSFNLLRITDTLHEDVSASRWMILSVRNISDKICRGNQNTHFMFNIIFPKIVPFMR